MSAYLQEQLARIRFHSWMILRDALLLTLTVTSNEAGRREEARLSH